MKIKLTERIVANLKPPKRALGSTSPATYIKYDKDVQGFGVRVTEKGTKIFILNYSIKGKERRLTIGFFPGDHSAESARRKARELRELIRDEKDPIEEREKEAQAKLQERTFKELAHDYLERHAIPNKRPASVRDDKSMLNGILLPRFGTRAVSAIGQREVEILMADLKPTKYRANRCRALLSKMYSLAIEWKWVTENPTEHVPPYPEERREFWLKTEQLKKLEKALDNFSNQDSANVIRLLMETGSRLGEALSARWEHFDLKQKMWHKPADLVKGKELVHVPLSDRAMTLLKRIGPKQTGFLFPGADGKVPRVSVKWAWQQVCRDAGLAREKKVTGVYRELSRWQPFVRLHDLRHTFASHLVSSGVSLPVVGSLLGHRQFQTTQRYAHVAAEAGRAAANKFGRREFKA